MIDVAPIDFKTRSRLPVIIQSEASECGLACIAMVLGFFGHKTDLLTLRQNFSVSLKGTSLKSLLDTASQLHLAPRCVKAELEELVDLRAPCILHWDLNHFVVLKKMVGGGKNAIIHDPARGEIKLTLAQVSEHFTGIAVELLPANGFLARTERRRLDIRHLLRGTVGLKRSLMQIMALAFALEVLSLISPFFMQWVVDGAILSADRNLLTTLVVGFLLLMVVQTLVGLARSWAVLYMSTHLNIQWVANVFTHLLRLPIEYFEKRHLGDVVSRFGSVTAIQKILTTNFVEGALDGLLAVATLIMMFLYNGLLASVVVASVTIYGILRSVAYGPFKRASEEQIILQAKEQSIFLESVRGIQSIKLFNHEDARRAKWLNALAEATNRTVATQKMSLGFSTFHTLVAGIENVVVIWLAASLVIDNRFSLGMLYAFMSYKGTFTSRVYALIDKVVDLRMVSVQLDRISDIVLTETERADHREGQSIRHLLTQSEYEAANMPALGSVNKSNDIEVRNVSFRYSDSEPWILRDVTLSIASGECVAIVGPSGCGKSTLMKLILGLHTPTAGEICVGGAELHRIEPSAYRDMIGTVMQEDQLLTGSIAENISFFDERPDHALVEACAAAAGVAREVEAMVMGYQTLIGDMGTALSGGQKQRVLLARALYKKPRILFLDEATSHLDIAKEREVNAAIAALNVTRVIVAHRPETIRAATRVIDLSAGKVVLASIAHKGDLATS